MNLTSSERLEDLQCDGLKIIQDKNLYAFSSDSVILANFIETKKNDICVEVGAGSGVISILLQAKHQQKKIYAFEIQPQMQNLCEKNILLNNLQEKIILCKDKIQNFEKYLQKKSVDVVFSNPPYFKKTDFEQNKVRKIAREEVCLSPEELVKTTCDMLKDGGSFYCSYSAERSVELFTLCQQNGLIIKEMFFTENGKGQVKLALFKAVKNAKNGVKVFKNLITNAENGDYLQELKTKNFKK
ncbi:MAG: methyltransferase [Clostridia bacterium]|nr:methyltransferase [Clostridia bacterium]